ncbi:uncharacterized protein LOC100830977 [Brachypodium distachyon]|uniref:Uncharacterized protein n=1 Tax=Brachypodium distachyon TaxID=15368 RepID=I1IP39_BRADI|nr:uncharacterized protein LOC100830977 [Brachypodium distachyon]KQJ89703.1 hypothetical protein BRADI_4g27260v3 [Brachypodium distachyon]|eukprot:XP_003577932.1 uncharacterized protein LOC100830977 [Brachypodium distachyon]
MDTVGARLSRSSTRYGPSSSSNASFSGPVRKWRKAWAPLAGGGNGGAGSASAGMGPMGCPRGNKVVLLKWAPVNGAARGAGDGDGNGKQVPAAAGRRRFVPASGVPQNPTKKSGSTELNLNLGLEDPDDDSDADSSADEQLHSENRLKRKVF